MEIEKAENGYIVKSNGETHVFRDLDEVPTHALEVFEGRHEWRGKDYGTVTVERERP